MSVSEFLRVETARVPGVCYPVGPLKLIYEIASRQRIGRLKFCQELGRNGVELVESPDGGLLALHRTVI